MARVHAEPDLTTQGVVEALSAEEKPDHAFLAATRGVRIVANNGYPADSIRDSIAIQSKIIYATYLHNAKRLLLLGSSWIYPKPALHPLNREYLLTGPLEPTNRPCARAKTADIEMYWIYNQQYGVKFLAVIPTTLYGQGDSHHPDNSHFIPAFICKIREAKQAKASTDSVRGTGIPPVSSFSSPFVAKDFRGLWASIWSHAYPTSQLHQQVLALVTRFWRAEWNRRWR